MYSVFLLSKWNVSFVRFARFIYLTTPSTYLPTYLPSYLTNPRTNQVTNSMQQSPYWQTNSSSASQIPHFVLNWNVHCRVHNNLPIVHILRQIGPVHTPILFLHTLILSSHPHLGLPTVFFPSYFPTKTLYEPLLSPILAACLDHLILLVFITQTVFGDEYRSLSSSLCGFLYSPLPRPS